MVDLNLHLEEDVESHSQVIKYWHFGLVGQVRRPPKEQMLRDTGNQ